MFSLLCFTALHFIFRIMTHFRLFLYMIQGRGLSCIFFFACGYPTVPSILAEKTILYPLNYIGIDPEVFVTQAQLLTSWVVPNEPHFSNGNSISNTQLGWPNSILDLHENMAAVSLRETSSPILLLWKTIWKYLLKQYMQISYDSAISPLGIY